MTNLVVAGPVKNCFRRDINKERLGNLLFNFTHNDRELFLQTPNLQRSCCLKKIGIGVGAGPAGQVLAGPLLSKVKMKLHFCKKQAMNRSASMIFRLVRLIVLLYNR